MLENNTKGAPVVASLQPEQECGGGSSQSNKAAKTSVDYLIIDFKDIFSDTAELPAARHAVTHHIIMDGQPVSACYRPLDAAKMAVSKQVFKQLEEARIIRRLRSQWASPLLMVRKADGLWRPFGYYRHDDGE
jgi:hypothetical protein